jgi:aminoglycoside 6-adenylyltransferase
LPSKLLPLPQSEIPTEDEYLNLVNDFWYHTVWTIKKLLRGELWAAKFCADGYMKQKLLWMLTFHAHVRNGWNYNTWHNGRFIDFWADGQAMSEMKFAFARYEKDDIARALMMTMDIFRRIALEVSEETGYRYPEDAEKSAREWIGKALTF